MRTVSSLPFFPVNLTFGNIHVAKTGNPSIIHHPASAV